jgi:hypothetical protein
LGDWDLNNTVNLSDIPAMLNALKDLNAYKSTNNLSTDDLLNVGDIDLSGVISNVDIQAELDLVSSLGFGSGAVASVPEPASLVLLGLGSLALIGSQLRRRRVSRPDAV